MGSGCWDFTGPCWNDLSTSTPHGPSLAGSLDQTLLVWIQTASGKLCCRCLHRESQMLSGPNFTLEHLMHFKKGFGFRFKQADGSSNASKARTGLNFFFLCPITHSPSSSPNTLLHSDEVFPVLTLTTPSNKHRLFSSLLQSWVLPVLLSTVGRN